MTAEQAARLIYGDRIATISDKNLYDVHVTLRDAQGETIIIARPATINKLGKTGPTKRLNPSEVRFISRPGPDNPMLYDIAYNEIKERTDDDQ